MKLLTTTVLAASFCFGVVFPADAGNTVGTVKAWQYMQADGWKSADGIDDNKLHNMLYQASVIDNYPWTKQFLLRVRGGGAIFLADKKTHTIRQLKLNPLSGNYNDIETVYQGENNGNGCYFAIIDNKFWARDEAEQNVLYGYPRVDNVENELAKIRQQFSPQVVMVMPDNCVNKQQQAVLAAKRSEEDQKLQQWVAQQSLAELCRRTGNC
ncbi:hypothetical protein [Rahnella sp. WP5]|uniref:hypothetical protein n=1 Tax=Rahnella sp. WP5 TaxID=1500266 RepID=UPI00056AB548|nr:hypothetical protein [Rahnella sp. WP5]